MDEEKLNQRLNDEEEMTDAEKRETFFSEIANEEAEKEWQDSH